MFNKTLSVHNKIKLSLFILYKVNYGSGGYLYAMDTAAVDIQCGQITNETLTLNECNVTGCEGYIFSNYVQSTIITCGEMYIWT